MDVQVLDLKEPPRVMLLCCVKENADAKYAPGKIETINGVETYVSLPEGDYPKDKAIRMCSCKTSCRDYSLVHSIFS